MLIACICVIAVFIIFVAVTFFVTKKSYSFVFNGKMIKITNAGSQCKIFINNSLSYSYHMPQFLKGETFQIKVGEKELVLKCKTNSYGNKFSLQAYCEDKEVYNNNVVVK